MDRTRNSAERRDDIYPISHHHGGEPHMKRSTDENISPSQNPTAKSISLRWHRVRGRHQPAALLPFTHSLIPAVGQVPESCMHFLGAARRGAGPPLPDTGKQPRRGMWPGIPRLITCSLYPYVLQPIHNSASQSASLLARILCSPTSSMLLESHKSQIGYCARS